MPKTSELVQPVEHRNFGGGVYPHRSRVTGYHSHL